MLRQVANFIRGCRCEKLSRKHIAATRAILIPYSKDLVFSSRNAHFLSTTTTSKGNATPGDSKKESPLMEQFRQNKALYPEYVLFMRVGDFYEFFYNDAVTASRALDIVLTKRSDIPMAGVPVHLLHQYLGKLVKQGFKAAICEQMESAEVARSRKGRSSIIKREVVRLVTPGTITDDFANDRPGQSNFLACILEHPSSFSGTCDLRSLQQPIASISWLNICSGEFLVATAQKSEDIEAYLAWMRPSELLVPKYQKHIHFSVLRKLIAENKIACPITEISEKTLDIDINDYTQEIRADAETIAQVLGKTWNNQHRGNSMETISGYELVTASTLLEFVEFTQKGQSFVLQPIKRLSIGAHMFMDAASRNSLNLTAASLRNLSDSKNTTDIVAVPGNNLDSAHIVQSNAQTPSRYVRRRSLASMIDRTASSMGARLLYSRLASPLTDSVRINSRLDLVDFFRQRGVASQLSIARDAVAACGDSERALQRLSLGRGSPSDLVRVASSMCHCIIALESVLDLPEGNQLEFEASLPTALLGRLRDHEEMFARITKYIRPAVSGGFNALGQMYGIGGRGKKTSKSFAERREIVRRGWSPEVDRLIELRSNIKDFFKDLESSYQTRFGLRDSLKIKFNQALGYHLEVPIRHKAKMNEILADGISNHIEGQQDSVMAVQPTRAALRYKTDEIIALEKEAQDAQRNLLIEEFTIFSNLRESTLKVSDIVLLGAKFMAELDVAQSNAICSAELGLVRPEILDTVNVQQGQHDSQYDADESLVLDLEECRHLLVEDFCIASGDSAFVPNDIFMTKRGGNNCWFITGPNMGGKSTFLRSIAHVVCLAQAGIFVPARRARVGVVDQLFSRVGASDDLAQGKSTFMVEMEETALILNRATPRSLVIVDEIGRGTSHKEGYAIAGAVLEELCGWKAADDEEENDIEGIGCRTLFATHYHDMVQMLSTTKAQNSSIEEDDEECAYVTLERYLHGLQRYTMHTVKGPSGDPVHTHKVIKGSAQSSHALFVTKMANLPLGVRQRADRLLKIYEMQDSKSCSN